MLKKYCVLLYFIISITAVVVLGYFTILAFVNPDVLKIKNTEETRKNSRIALTMSTIFYAILMFFLGITYRKI